MHHVGLYMAKGRGAKIAREVFFNASKKLWSVITCIYSKSNMFCTRISFCWKSMYHRKNKCAWKIRRNELLQFDGMKLCSLSAFSKENEEMNWWIRQDWLGTYPTRQSHTLPDPQFLIWSYPTLQLEDFGSKSRYHAQFWRRNNCKRTRLNICLQRIYANTNTHML